MPGPLQLTGRRSRPLFHRLRRCLGIRPTLGSACQLRSSLRRLTLGLSKRIPRFNLRFGKRLRNRRNLLTGQPRSLLTQLSGSLTQRLGRLIPTRTCLLGSRHRLLGRPPGFTQLSLTSLLGLIRQATKLFLHPAPLRKLGLQRRLQRLAGQRRHAGQHLQTLKLRLQPLGQAQLLLSLPQRRPGRFRRIGRQICPVLFQKVQHIRQARLSIRRTLQPLRLIAKVHRRFK